MYIHFPLLLSEADLWLSIYMPSERHVVQRYMESPGHFPGQDDGLVESPFPQPLGMKRDGHDQRVFSDIESWVREFRHQFPEELTDMYSPVVFKPVDRFEEGGFVTPYCTGGRID